MNPVAAPPIPASAKPQRRRWLRIVLVLITLLIIVPLAYFSYSTYARESAWNAAVAEAERDLTRWRLMELEEDRPKIPDAENSALHMIAVNRMSTVSVMGAPNYEQIFERLPPSARLNTQQAGLIRGELAKLPSALQEARKLKDMPRGRYSVQINDNIIMTPIADHQKSRQIAYWLQHDAYLLAHDGEPDRAIESCQAVLNAGRAMEGDPYLITYLIRRVMQLTHVEAVERVLAQGNPSERSLERSQTLLDKEIRESSLLPAMRGERAGMHHLFENFKSGKIDSKHWSSLQISVGSGAGPIGKVSTWLMEAFPTTLLNYYPGFLQHMNRAVEITKLPSHERLVRFEELQLETAKSGNPLIRSLAPAFATVNRSETASQAILRAAMAGIACERYRIKHGEFPVSLDTLVKANLLDAVPVDPFDNQPLRYRRTKVGVAIYSIGIDGVDDDGNIDNGRSQEKGVDVGFRLWNVETRRQPPLPTVVLPEVKR
jgi:hypothetical protein